MKTFGDHFRKSDQKVSKKHWVCSKNWTRFCRHEKPYKTCRKWRHLGCRNLKKSKYSTGCIRVAATRSGIWKNSKFDRFYKVFRCFAIVLRAPSLGNAFLVISGSIAVSGLKKSRNSTGFIRVFATRFCISKNSKFIRFIRFSDVLKSCCGNLL